MKLESLFVAVLLFSVIVTGFFIVPNMEGGFWKGYDYSPPDNNASSYDKNTATYSQIINIKCQLNPGSSDPNSPNYDSDCADVSKPSLKSFVQGLWEGLAQSGWSALLTIVNMPKMINDLVLDIGTSIGIPTEILQPLFNILLVVVLIALILIIFNRQQ